MSWSLRQTAYGWGLIQKKPNKSWNPLIGFRKESQIDDDYIKLYFFYEKHIGSTFNKFMKISIFTEDSNLNIIGDEFRITKNDKVTEHA